MNSQPKPATFVTAEPRSAPIILLAGNTDPKHKRRADRRAAAETHPDAELIEHCVGVAMHIAAGRAAFKADPTGDSDFAQVHDSLSQKRTRKCLEAATKASATTLDGLRAKASLVSIMIDDLDGSPLEDYHEQFLRSFAADVVGAQKIVREARAAHRPIEDLESVKA